MNNQSLTVKEYCTEQGFPDDVVDGGIPYLVGLWERTAEHVLDYRKFYLDNYLNDLAAREILAELLPLASEAEIAEAKIRIEVADAKFIVNSVDAPSCVWGLKAKTRHQWTPQQNWWYYRMPKQIGPDF